MLLYHATTRANLGSILEAGLLVRYAGTQGKIKGVWLHAPSKSPWAILHTQKRHTASLEEVIVIAVEVPRKRLKRCGKGLWYTMTDIDPQRIRRIMDGTAYAASTT